MMSPNETKITLSTGLTETGLSKRTRSTLVIENEERATVAVENGSVILTVSGSPFGCKLSLAVQEAEHLASLLLSGASKLRSEGNV